jgi:hypothetical protein
MNDWATERAEHALASWGVAGREIVVEAVAAALRQVWQTERDRLGSAINKMEDLLEQRDGLKRQLVAERERWQTANQTLVHLLEKATSALICPQDNHHTLGCQCDCIVCKQCEQIRRG